MSKGPLVMVAAGGTGGHLFPASALSDALIARGMAVELITDARAEKYGAAFPARAIHKVQAGTPSGGSLLQKGRAVLALMRGTLAARRLLKRLRPDVLVGFGGYPTVPPVLAAASLHVPVILHEGNVVMGRANRFLAPCVDAIAKGFEALGGVGKKIRAKAHRTGNPLRPAVIEAARLPFPAFSDGKLRLLVTGGSQGARIMSDIVPAAVALLPADLQQNLIIVQQARGEDETRVRAAYQKLGIEAEVESFFTDFPFRIAMAHLIIGRAGASTISELALIGRPAILVPLPHALDQDQAANAGYFAATGAAIVIGQAAFTPTWLAGQLTLAQADLAGLQSKAEAAKSAGIADAAERLADLVASFIAKPETIS
jgi:UDP-N-acetylglucosamine--N-acetylmuramyl-(pentapeptide) pyrophosphoryl-undecaprenol N-acetylglucosamine transferase